MESSNWRSQLPSCQPNLDSRQTPRGPEHNRMQVGIQSETRIRRST